MSDKYEYMYGGRGVPVKAWTKGVEMADNARDQIMNVATLPFIHKHVAVMPDVHWGMGCTIGSVIATKGAIIPAAVGVDIGCGMMAVPTSITADDLPDNLFAMRSAIEKAVPHGRTNNGKPGDRGAWGTPPKLVVDVSKHLLLRLHEIMARHPKILRSGTVQQRMQNHLGTLGTGNHFIEVCLDETDKVWVMLHSGSRGVGNAIGMYFINKAKEDMRRWFINLPDQDLAYLVEGTEHFDDYCEAVEWAQDYALENRKIMMANTMRAIAETLGGGPGLFFGEAAVNCHHNYISRENHFGSNVWVTRKGALRAREGDLGIIPGSMGARSFIVRGKGEADSFHSCSHGAGRVMSRNEAKRTVSLEQHIRDTKGVESRQDASVIDETPSAYKNIDAVMDAQSDLVEIVHTLKQVLCVKG